MSFDEADYQAERASVTEVLWSLVDSPWDLGSTLQVILDNAVRLARSAQDAHRFGQHLSNPEVGSIGLHRPQQEGNIARGRGLADLGEQSKIALSIESVGNSSVFCTNSSIWLTSQYWHRLAPLPRSNKSRATTNIALQAAPS